MVVVRVRVQVVIGIILTGVFGVSSSRLEWPSSPWWS